MYKHKDPKFSFSWWIARIRLAVHCRINLHVPYYAHTSPVINPDIVWCMTCRSCSKEFYYLAEVKTEGDRLGELEVEKIKKQQGLGLGPVLVPTKH